MTPKEKAEQLCKKMLYQVEWNDQPSTLKLFAKHCALIAVEQILSIKIIRKYNLINKYWQEVKQEIENL